MDEDDEYGFVPRHVLRDLVDIGNWKSRASAMDTLQKALSSAEASKLTPHLGPLITFLLSLVSDPNFRVAISSMSILGDLLSKVGRDVEPHLRTVLTGLVEKLTDSKILVRNANMKVVKRLLSVVSPRRVAEELCSGMRHSSWRVREDVLNILIVTVLYHGHNDLDYQNVLKTVVDALCYDTMDRVKVVALECLAVLCFRLGLPEFYSLLSRTRISDDARRRVQQRLKNPSLPTANEDGLVEHVVDLPYDNSATALYAGRPGNLVATGCHLPWEQRPQRRSGVVDKLNTTSPQTDPGSGGKSAVSNCRSCESSPSPIFASSNSAAFHCRRASQTSNEQCSSLMLHFEARSHANDTECHSKLQSPKSLRQVYQSCFVATPTLNCANSSISSVQLLDTPSLTHHELAKDSSLLGSDYAVLTEGAGSAACHTSDLATSSGLWLQANSEPVAAYAYRADTLSPSKAKTLANLKRRQIEKRANSAQLPQTETPGAALPAGRYYLSSLIEGNIVQPHAAVQDASCGGNRSEQLALATDSGLLALGKALSSGSELLLRPTQPQALNPFNATVSTKFGASSQAERLRVHSADCAGKQVAVPFTPKQGNKLDELSYNDLFPLPDPSRSMRLLLQRLVEANNSDRKQLDWVGQYDALNEARCIVKYHPEIMRSCLHDFVKAAVPALDALRSFTSKNAMLLFLEMFQFLGKAMDKVLDDIVPTLLKKSGEISNAGRENFLASEADRVLMQMSTHTTDTRAISSLLSCVGNRSMHVRAKVAFHLDNILELTQSGTSLLSNWACLDKLFKAAACFLEEGSLETRTYGKRIIWHLKTLLGSKGEFDRLLSGVHDEMLARKVMDVVESSNGPPPPPSTRSVVSRLVDERTSPSGICKVGQLEASHIPRSTSYSAPVGFSTGEGSGTIYGRLGSSSIDSGVSSSAPPAHLGRLQRGCVNLNRTRSNNERDCSIPSIGINSTTATIVDQLNRTLAQLAAKDFRERLEALRTIETILPHLQFIPDANVIVLLDGITGRLQDGNSKVNIQTLELLGHMFSVLRDRVSLGLNTLVPALASNLGSTNDRVRAVAAQVTDKLINAVDPSLLVQNFSHCVSNGNLRGKHLLVEKLRMIISAAYPIKPQLVVKYAVPAALALLNDTKGDTKAASMRLLACLAKLLGRALLDHASNMNVKARDKVQDALASMS